MSDVRHIPFQLRFEAPLLTARGRIESRRGFLFGVDYEGHVYVSEVTLLPEFGTEYFEHAERVLSGETRMFTSAPAILFAADCLRASTDEIPDHPVQIPIAYLLRGENRGEILADAVHAHNAGHAALKLKVGFRDIAEDIAIVNEITDRIDGVKLRIDANLSWTAEATARFLKRIAVSAIEWIEDPFRGSLEEWSYLQSEGQVPFACDEAYSAKDLLGLESWNGFEVLIVKPSRTGTIGGEIRPLAERAKNERRKFVISSMFESSVGMTYLAHLAAKFGSAGVAQGLGTLPYLKDDTTISKLNVENCVLHAPPPR
jgi:o-succinylbenzoate synthase